MKVSAFAIAAAAAAGAGVGVSAMPMESGPLSHLQNRAAEAIGGVVSFIRREEMGSPVVPHQLKRASPVRFHSARDVAYNQRRESAGRNLEARKEKEKKEDDEDVPPLAPFSIEDVEDE